MRHILQFVTLLFLTMAKLANADKPPPIIVSGMCSSKSAYDGFYQAMYETNSGRYYYESDNGMFIYFDPTCDGTGSINLPNLWIFDNSEPSTTAVNDLDGEFRINVALLYFILTSLSICR